MTLIDFSETHSRSEVTLAATDFMDYKLDIPIVKDLFSTPVRQASNHTNVPSLQPLSPPLLLSPSSLSASTPSPTPSSPKSDFVDADIQMKTHSRKESFSNLIPLGIVDCACSESSLAVLTTQHNQSQDNRACEAWPGWPCDIPLSLSAVLASVESIRSLLPKAPSVKNPRKPAGKARGKARGESGSNVASNPPISTEVVSSILHLLVSEHICVAIARLPNLDDEQVSGAASASSSSRSDTCNVRFWIWADVSTPGSNEQEFRDAWSSLYNLYLDITPSKWTRGDVGDGQVQRYFPNSTEERRERLIQVFHSLSSPHVNISNIPTLFEPLITSALCEKSPPCVSTTLFGYQRQALAKILQRESCPEQVSDPRYIELKDVTGCKYFLDSNDWTHKREVEAFEEPRAGIIAEEMGSGKTLICISAIGATRRHLAMPPSTAQVTCTPYHRESTDSDQDEQIVLSPNRIPSLSVLAAHALISHRIPPASELDRLPDVVSSVLQSNPPYYIKYRTDDLKKRLRRGGEKGKGLATKVFLSWVTLIIVPDVLLDQWQSQFNLHTFSESLRILVISGTDVMIPPALDLVKYDVVIMSSLRFGQEESEGGLEIGGVVRKCDCPYVGSTRNTDCRCKERYYTRTRPTSPLLQLKWLRVIVDEGHGLAQNNNATSLATKLNYERFWSITKIVTGTPFPEEMHGDAEKAEAKDFTKLETLLTRYLKLKPFTSDPKVSDSKTSWKKYVTRPFQSKEFGALERLKSIMHRVMIRHREEDRSRDIALPQLVIHDPVAVALNRYLKLVHNVFVAGIVVNKVLSQETDEDYFFHPSNASFRRLVIANMRLSFMWWSSFEKTFVADSLANIREALNKRGVQIKKKVKVEVDCSNQIYPDIDQMRDYNGPRQASKSLLVPQFVFFTEQDVKDLKECEQVFEEAQNDRLFKYLNIESVEGDVGYIIRALEKPVTVPELHFAPVHSTWPGLESEIFDTAQSCHLDDSAHTNELQQKVSLVRFERPPEQNSKNTEDLYLMRTLLQQRSPGESVERLRVSIRDAIGTDAGEEHQREFGAAPFDEAASENQSAETVIRRQTSHNERAKYLDLFKVNPVVVACMSEKVTFLVDRVREHSNDGEKTIIYVQHANEVYHLHEAFRIAKIRCLLFHQQMSRAERSSTITTFNTATNFWAIIMNIDIAAYGIDLHTASRIYFTAPVCSAAKERQAIARAHRIGQKRVVHAVTLFAKGTIEEEMVQRKDEIDREGTSFSSIKDSAILIKMLQDAKYIPFDPLTDPFSCFSSPLPLLGTMAGDTPHHGSNGQACMGSLSAEVSVDYYYQPVERDASLPSSSGVNTVAKSKKSVPTRQGVISPSKGKDTTQNKRKSDNDNPHNQNAGSSSHGVVEEIDPNLPLESVALEGPPRKRVKFVE
ncbi:hypothetical protein HDU93_001383 [Gonapodya sp. JEL0774]|nr:hypothetical protein HDU93_001383 [Gonapodya sp. JEL0774]